MPDGDYDPDRLQSERPSGTPVTRVRPQKLSRDDAEKLVTKYNPDITKAAVAGEVDNIMRESGGNAANKTGDGGTSGGLYQHHLGRLTGLKEFAAKEKADWTDPDIQVRYSRLEKERDYPALLKLQQTNDDRGRNEDAFKRIFERPASVLWGNDASGQPVLGNDKYRFSDYAMKEHDGRKNTDMLMMTPAEYLDLSPELSPKPFENPAGRALKKSFDKGDAIESVPTLDVNVGGSTATVTDQDGRHRALLAQQNGIEAIPVAVRKTGEGDPKEIVGLNGVPMAHDFPKASDVQGRQAQQPTEPIPLQAKPEERSLLGRVANAIIPSAGATEVDNPFAKYVTAPTQTAAPPVDDNPFAKYVTPVQGGDQQQTPIAEMTQEQAQKANLSPEQQARWIKAQHDKFLPNQVGTAIGDVAGAVGRGVAPYAAGAAAGAVAGAPFAGVGAIPGAVAGAGAVGLTQIATGMMGTKTPGDVTNAALTGMGVREPGPAGRIIEQAAGGAANAVTGAGAMGLLARSLTNPLSRAVAGVMAEHQGMQAASGALGGAASQGTAEVGAPGWAQQLAGLIGALVPGGKAMAPNRWHINASDAAKKAIEAGFVLPPAEATAGHIGEMNLANTAAAEAGKIKTGQQASAINQPRVNVKVQQELGVPSGTPLTPSVLERVRAREGQVYQEVQRAIPEVDLGLDPEFRADVAGLGKRSESTEATFPSTKEPPEIPALRAEMLKHARAGTKEVMNYIADLRARANQMFRTQNDAMAHRKGFALREAATALEDSMERSVEKAPEYFREKLDAASKFREQVFQERLDQGLPLTGEVYDRANAEVQRWSDQVANANAKDQNNMTLMDRFRKARQTMAKSYDVEAVTNPSSGDVSATGLGRLLKKGRPLTGNLKVIADAANQFHRAFQNPAAFGGVEPLSILDVGFATAEAAKAAANLSIPHAIAALAPLLRPFARGAVLSDKRQAAMIAPPQTPSAPLSALTTPLLPTQPTGNAMAGMMGGQQ